MERITHKQDGSEFDPEVDLVTQLLEDGAEEITRPGAFEARLVAARWFRYPPMFDAQDTIAVFDGELETAPPADTVILEAETPTPEDGSLLDAIDKMAPVDEPGTES